MGSVRTAMLLTAALLLLPASSLLAQDSDQSAPSTDPGATASPDPRLIHLASLVPPAIAGLATGEHLELATGEQLINLLRPAARAVLESLLEANDAVVADYAAASTWVTTAEAGVAVLQAHRIEGVDAAATIDSWVELVSLDLEEPASGQGFVSGQPVTVVSDTVTPEVPPLYLFPRGDVVWMVVAPDDAIVTQIMAAVGAARTGPPPGTPGPPAEED